MTGRKAPSLKIYADRNVPKGTLFGVDRATDPKRLAGISYNAATTQSVGDILKRLYPDSYAEVEQSGWSTDVGRSYVLKRDLWIRYGEAMCDLDFAVRYVPLPEPDLLEGDVITVVVRHSSRRATLVTPIGAVSLQRWEEHVTPFEDAA